MAGFEAPPSLEAALAAPVRAAVRSANADDIPQIRLSSLREAALGYGVRSGLARRSYEISRVVADNEALLDRIFNFGSLVLDRNVLPPVLSEAVNSLRQPDGDTIRIADLTYRIERQAAFVTSPPGWREYLVLEHRYEVSLPAPILLPKTTEEKSVWAEYVREGWNTGVRQADSIYEQSLSRLERDFKGMVLYRSLLAKGMIGRPYVAEASLGVTGDGESMAVNDRILRITSKPRLNGDPAVWKAVPVPAAGGDR